MTEEQSGGSAPASDEDLRQIVRDHTQDIAQLRQDVGEIKLSQNNLRDEVIAMRAEGKQWRVNSDQKTESLQTSIDKLTREMAVRNGVEQERNRQSQERTQALRRLSLFFGMLCAILGLISTTLFSSQTFDTAFWGHFHLHPRTESHTHAKPDN
ncbi:hypothetical protein [Acetobacter thailandicus]|uniref:DUF1515 domain-containing protein n=1 Tax=Acetobacter thailandicus TaxID=1502842 RepID=A0ABT3QDJ2_9PROT|nr:hypothetical protein [Acetobacter thailandicus]MCX2563330.1 hypothetical protein [Acetobacter thailandicus]NHN94084.1 hypothetical protein [Acetobacter thailandicus]